MTISKTPENIQNLFNQIAAGYDFMNNLISFGLHRAVKSRAAELLDIKPHSRILDACCGTGDIAELIKTKEPFAEVTGIDFSESMLSIAKKRINTVNFISGDITATEFPSESFDIVTMAFGLRNIQNAEKALCELHRILKPGGEFLHLDFGKKNIFSRIFDFEAPVLASIFTKYTEPYKYLVKSKEIFPSPNELIKDFEKCGFKLKTRKDFVLGAISAQIMEKI